MATKKRKGEFARIEGKNINGKSKGPCLFAWTFTFAMTKLSRLCEYKNNTKEKRKCLTS